MEQRVEEPRHSFVAAWIAFLAIAVLAWVFTIAETASTSMAALMPLPAFVAFWVVMMVAMMFPSVAPAAMLWSGAITRSSSGTRRALRMAQFIGGYLIAWSAFGLVAYWVLVQLAAFLGRAPQDARWIGSSVFLLAAVYQATPLKRACLLHCRSPFGAFVRYAAFPRTGRDLLVGLHHGTYCVGCCWGLMAVLAAAGVMNLAAMAVVASIIFIEKRSRWGAQFARLLPAVFLMLALLAALYPGLFPGLLPAMPG